MRSVSNSSALLYGSQVSVFNSASNFEKLIVFFAMVATPWVFPQSQKKERSINNDTKTVFGFASPACFAPDQGHHPSAHLEQNGTGTAGFPQPTKVARYRLAGRSRR